MNMARVWPIVVQFGVGALLSWVGIWCGFRSGYLDMKSSESRRLLFVLVAGFVLLLAFSCAFTFWLPFVPREAAAAVREMAQ